jgi:glutathionyl-hydroquinone reductase
MTAAAYAREAYASEIDAFSHGEYHPNDFRRGPAFLGRIQPGAVAGRYHLYVSWASIPSHHTAILRTLLGLEDVVSLSYVDSLRDGRGWAFRNRTGPDSINGFTLLRQAYEATDPGFAGEIRVPLLWDRQAGAIACDDPDLIITDLLEGFGADPLRTATVGLAAGTVVAAEVERLKRTFADELNAVAALRDSNRRPYFRQALMDLDRRLATRRYLVGDDLSDADIRVWVRLARLDAGPNASGTIGPRLDHYPHVWRWATALYELPAFFASTDFRRFAAPFADLPPWWLSRDRERPKSLAVRMRRA